MKNHGISTIVLLLSLGLGAGCGGGGGAPVCGDGVIEGAEVCDDGNVLNGDGCAVGCYPERGYTCTGGLDCHSTCGDGVQASDEVCDPTDFGSSEEYCADDCSAVIGSCGDSILQPTVEDCDDGNTDTSDGCRSTCDASFAWTCTSGTCDASTAPRDATISSLSSGDKSALCTWVITTFGGAGAQTNCGTYIYTTGTVSSCVSNIVSNAGSCTVAEIEAWFARRANVCDAFESEEPFCL